MSEQPWIVEPFCGAGGSTRGLQLAGFRVFGIDKDPQPNYCGDEFVQGDALEFLADRMDTRPFVAALVGPPCQGYSSLKAFTAGYPRWIGVVRILLRHVGLPYIIENVVGARSAMVNPIMLCGSSFGLGVRRHRLFETSFPVGFVPPCAHYLQPAPIDVTGTGASRIGPRTDGGGGNSRKPRNLAHARDVMGIDWMTRPELAEAIPPRMTEWVGAQLLTHLGDRAA